MKLNPRSLDRWITADNEDFGPADAVPDATASADASTNETATESATKYYAVYQVEAHAIYVQLFTDDDAAEIHYGTIRSYANARTIGRTTRPALRLMIELGLAGRFPDRPIRIS